MTVSSELIIPDLPDKQLFSILLNLKDSYTQFTAPYVNFLMERKFKVNYRGLKFYYDYLDSEYKEGDIAARTFNVLISAAKNRTRLLFQNSKSALEIAKRFMFEQKLSELKLKKTSGIVNENKAVSKEDVKKLIENCKDEGFALLIEFLFYTGLRIFEALNIKFTHMEYIESKDNYRIRIHGKGDKERFIFVKKELIDRINQFYNRDREKLFDNSKYGTPYTYQNVSMRFKKLSRKVLNRNLSIHSTRHGFVTSMLKAGKDINEVSLYCGHQSVNTTYDMYYHGKLNDEDLVEVEL